ncbi:MAG: GNAT family N-acetyltransferase [Lachnospiraceae bacterium]|nr:GNAT family N-acetyltransferase [Lachnospiraceae bacterium]
MGLFLRGADINDAEIILEWRNDSVTREHSFSKECIDYETHMKWYKSKLSDKDCYLFILMDNTEKIGHLRIDRVNDVGRISYTIAPGKRNRGYGKKIIELSERVVTDGIHALVGMVELSNEPSRKCFRHNNYAEFASGDIYFYIKLI